MDTKARSHTCLKIKTAVARHGHLAHDFPTGVPPVPLPGGRVQAVFCVRTAFSRVSRQALAVLVCVLVLAGCTSTPHRADLDMFMLVAKGKASYKQTFLWFERTTYDSLLQRGAYFAVWRRGKVDEARAAPHNQPVEETIAEVASADRAQPTSYLLVRGIAPDEVLLKGRTGQPQASSLTVIPGDLLIIDPPPGHVLLRKASAQARSSFSLSAGQ